MGLGKLLPRRYKETAMFDKKPKKPETFAEDLLGDFSFASFNEEERVESIQDVAPLTEKGLILDSFTRFAEEKISGSPSGVVSFPGGELALKPQPTVAPFSPQYTSRNVFFEAQSGLKGAKVWQALSAGKNSSVQVFFIGESLREESVLEQQIQGIREEFLVSFPPPVADLFQKMVQAMKLTPGEYVLGALRDAAGELTNDRLFEEIHWWAPKFVVPLGALATQAILGSKERLALIHGKFSPLPRLSLDSVVVPLFHPSVIATNANMKKSTWQDMQKIMQALGKI